MDPLGAVADVGALVRSGALRPLGPRVTLELVRLIAREGVRAHLILAVHGLRDPARPAIVYEGATTTWGDLYDRVLRLANHLLTRGIGPGDGVAIMLPNRPEFLETQAAALRIGATTSFVNPRAPAAEARSLFDRTEAKLVITHRPEVAEDGSVAVLEVGADYEAAVAAAAPGEPRVPRGAEGRVVVFTSGTTGRPKGAVRNMDDGGSLGTLAGFLRSIPFRRDDRHMVVCPLYHSSGSGFASISMALGATIVCVEKFSPEVFCRTVQAERVTTTTVVPTMLHQVCSWEGAGDYDLSSLRVVVCTGSPLREQVRERARELVGDVLYDLYGSTEMSWVSVATPADQRRKPGTVGRPVPGVSVRILDPDGKPLPRGEVGEIWASNRLMMQEYLKDPELTSERMRDGYVSVRDLGYLDIDGYLHVIDRADDMIISGGVNVYPAEVEIALSAHPDVAEAAVLGLPDDKWGQRIVAAVVPRGEVDPDELVAWCKERVSYAAVPKEVRFLEALPRNDIGKVARKRLVEEWT